MGACRMSSSTLTEKRPCHEPQDFDLAWVSLLTSIELNYQADRKFRLIPALFPLIHKLLVAAFI
jgi:hypothetical protein